MGKGALVAGLGLMAVALVALTPVPALFSRRTELLSARMLTRQASQLEASAAKYQESAASMIRRAHERKAEAADVQAMETYLHTAQSELDAYAANVEGLVDATNSAKLQGDMSQFPREAAELHALLDHSLGKADGAAVKIARIGRDSAGSPPVLPRRARIARQQDRVRGSTKQAATGGGRKKSLAHPHRQVLRATATSPLHNLSGKTAPLSNLDKVKATLKQLGAVKSFAREAAHGEARRLAASALLDSVQSAAAHGKTHVLQQQPAPLLGAMNVRDGELIDGDPKYKPSDVGLTKEAPEFVKMQNSLMPEYNPDEDKLLACNEKCQHDIIHSTIGLTFKVATKCVPGCAKGDYTLHTKGAPLPEWEDAAQLAEQDQFCDADPVYMKCKWESLDALCDKMTEFMPQYCLGHPNDGICKQCVKVELYEANVKAEFKADCQKKQNNHVDPLPEGCDDVLSVGSWQNATTPEDMMRGLEDEE